MLITINYGTESLRAASPIAVGKESKSTAHNILLADKHQTVSKALGHLRP